MSKNIKEIGKELMGNTLNSFHRKAGIKKLNENNKMQDGILDGILSQADNPYRGHSETGNVIHLEGSGDGVVVLGDIEGNTMVNHCLDGSKEFILNGDIDIEGNLITTTEGVDNGLVDIMCEGHTAVNISKTKDKTPITHKFEDGIGNDIKLEGSTAGYVDIEKIVGNTIVNCLDDKYLYYDVYTKQVAILDSSNSVSNTESYRIKKVYLKKDIGYGNTYTISVNVLELTNTAGIASYIQYDDDEMVYSVFNPKQVGVFKQTFITKNKKVKAIALYLPYNAENVSSAKIQDLMVLEDDYTSKSIPNEYFEGLQSSFEDNYIPANLSNGTIKGSSVSYDTNTKTFTTNLASNRACIYVNNVKPTSVYTIISYNDLISTGNYYEGQASNTIKGFAITDAGNGIYKLITSENCLSLGLNFKYSDDSTVDLSNVKIVILEGDYVSNIPSYEEVINKSGKYKVPVKIVGKNKLSNVTLNKAVNDTTGAIYESIGTSTALYIPVTNKTYSLTGFNVNRCVAWTYDKNDNYLGNINFADYKNVKFNDNVAYIHLKVAHYTDGTVVANVQLEEGSATPYEPYFERTSNAYLNSPLLEGDELVIHNGELCHYHKCDETIFDGSNDEKWVNWDSNGVLLGATIDGIPYDNSKGSDIRGKCDKLPVVVNGVNGYDCIGFRQIGDTLQRIYLSKSGFDSSTIKTWLQSNPLKVVYNLKEPYYEPIQADKLLLECTNDSTLHIDTVVPTQLITFKSFEEKIEMLEPNTEYRVSFRSDKENISLTITLGGKVIQHTTSLYNTLLITTPATLTNNLLVIDGQGCQISECVITKGNMEYPYFEGMKSVGQDDTAGHKVEILSMNKNLLPILNLDIDSEGYANREQPCWQNVKLKPNTKYTLSYTGKAINYTNSQMWAIWIKEQTSNKPVTTDNIISSSKTEISSSFTTSNEDLYEITIKPNNGDDTGSYLFKPDTLILEEGEKTSYISHDLNKKEILLTEPLRSVDYAKDSIIKIDGKWYIERKCKKVVLDGSITPTVNSVWETENQLVFNIPNIVSSKDSQKIINNKFKKGLVTTTDLNEECIQTGGNGVPYTHVYVKINKSRLLTLNVEGVKNWLKSNPITVVYELATPIYEPLEIEPTLNTYTDTTHISNNSIIPCNMKVKNTGYNAIIKPSTLYTVAVDTDKNGTIGIDISGTKVATTNNVATITTPATLTDDSLRLYGKGIKGSKVRFIEGDKTNWVPGYFEGMKSSFEDKFDSTDNSYKMEILNSNENLFDINKYSTNDKWHNKGWGKYNIEVEDEILKLKAVNGWQNYWFDFYFELGKTYTLRFKAKLDSSSTINGKIKISKYFTTDDYTSGDIMSWVKPNGDWIEYDLTFTPRYRMIGFNCFINGEGKNHVITWLIKDIQISEKNIEYKLHKSNKIQFSLSEPLRAIGDIKDKLCIKNNKLVVERNCGHLIINGTETITHHKVVGNTSSYRIENVFNKNGAKILVDKYPILTFSILYNTETKCVCIHPDNNNLYIRESILQDEAAMKAYLQSNNIKVVHELAEPIYEEVLNEYGLPIMLEGYENGTVYIETEMAPTVNLKYTPKMESFAVYKEVSSDNDNLTDNISNNVITYMMEIDSKIVEKELNTPVLYSTMRVQSNMQERTKDMLIRLFEGGSLTKEQCLERIELYSIAGKINEQHVEELTDLVNNIYK